MQTLKIHIYTVADPFGKTFFKAPVAKECGCLAAGQFTLEKLRVPETTDNR